MSKKEVRSKGWCFTVNNYTDDDIAYVMSLYEEDYTCEYLIVGFEVGDRDGTPHMQCFINYRNQRYFTPMQKLLYGYHIEKQKSKSAVAAAVYCTKEHDVYEVGHRPQQGHRTDLQFIQHDIISGRPYSHIRDQYLYQFVYHYRFFDMYKRLKCRFETKVYFFDQNNTESVDKVVSMLTEDDLLTGYLFSDNVPTDIYIKYKSGVYRNIYFPLDVTHNQTPPPLFCSIPYEIL